MSKKDYYIVEKNIDKIIRERNTNFLDPNILKKVMNKLKGYNYNVYYPYKDSEKAIIYVNKIPKIKLIEIISQKKLTHREIMGSLYNLNIDTEMFGDIIITDNHYYILIMNSVYNTLANDFKVIGRNNIKIKETSLEKLRGFTRKYEEIQLITQSLRIDAIISKIVGASRDSIKKKFFDNEITLNYELCNKLNHILKSGDIFSIRRKGKYKFDQIIKNTRKDKYIIKLYKYIDN